MSRIERDRVEEGEVTSQTELNDTYSDYSQPGALNATNTRDQAFDLPHLTGVSIVVNKKTALLGNAGMAHSTTPTTVASSAAAPGTLHPVQDSGGTETFLDLSSNPWTLESDEILRLWWNLSVITEYSGSPWDGASVLGRYDVGELGGGGTVTISDGMHCWLAYLEWDTTDGTLTNWTPVPGQQAPTSSFGSLTGVYVNDLAASSVISPWVVHSFAFANAGEMPTGNTGRGEDHGWHGHYGMWAHKPSSPVTVYGVRLIITGLMHPGHLTSNGQNILIYDFTPSATLKYIGGRLSALQMKVG